MKTFTLFLQEQEVLKAAEIEIAETQLQRRRNKSGLHHSDRQMLRGEPPAVGLYMQWKERHTSRQYKVGGPGQITACIEYSLIVCIQS